MALGDDWKRGPDGRAVDAQVSVGLEDGGVLALGAGIPRDPKDAAGEGVGDDDLAVLVEDGAAVKGTLVVRGGAEDGVRLCIQHEVAVAPHGEGRVQEGELAVRSQDVAGEQDVVVVSSGRGREEEEEDQGVEGEKKRARPGDAHFLSDHLR